MKRLSCKINDVMCSKDKRTACEILGNDTTVFFLELRTKSQQALSGQLEAGVLGAYPREVTEPTRKCELTCLGGALLLSYNLVTFMLCQ